MGHVDASANIWTGKSDREARPRSSLPKSTFQEPNEAFNSRAPLFHVLAIVSPLAPLVCTNHIAIQSPHLMLNALAQFTEFRTVEYIVRMRGSIVPKLLLPACRSHGISG